MLAQHYANLDAKLVLIIIIIFKAIWSWKLCNSAVKHVNLWNTDVEYSRHSVFFYHLYTIFPVNNQLLIVKYAFNLETLIYFGTSISQITFSVTWSCVLEREAQILVTENLNWIPQCSRGSWRGCDIEIFSNWTMFCTLSQTKLATEWQCALDCVMPLLYMCQINKGWFFLF